MSDDKRTIGDMLAEHVRERMQRERTALDDAVWALLQAGAKLEHIVIQHWPNGMGDDPTPRTSRGISAYAADLAGLRRWLGEGTVK